MQVIVTIRILSWSLLSLGAFLLMLVALFSPAWLVGPALTVSNHNKTAHHHVSVGVYAKCGRPIHNGVLQKESCTTIALHGFAADSEIYPNVWKASMFFIAFGLSVMTVAVLSAFFSLCVQSICRKSIYTLLGVTQAFAGVFYILGITLYPMGWNSLRVAKLCGPEASFFYPGDCKIGLGLWFAIVGTLLTLTSAVLSVSADKSSSSRYVEDQIQDGQTLICAV